MNKNQINVTAAAAGLATGVMVGIIALQHAEIQNLKKQLSKQETATHVWKRAMKSAMHNMARSQLLDIIEQTHVDQKFDSIVRDV